jgi:hypothetical protein
MDEHICQQLQKYIGSFALPKRIPNGLQLMIHAASYTMLEPPYTLQGITDSNVDLKIVDDIPLDVALERIGQPCEVLSSRVVRIPSERIREVIIYRGSYRGDIEVLEQIKL